MRRQRAISSGGDNDLSLRFAVGVFSQWWKTLVPATLFALALSIGLILYLFEPQYRASAWLLIQDRQPYIAFPEESRTDRDATRKYVHTQIELLRSPLILGRALGQPDVSDTPELKQRRDPVDWLSREGLQVIPKGDSELLEISFTGADPKLSAKLVDAVVNAYFAIRDERSSTQIQSIIMQLEDEKTRRAEGIKLLQTEIRQLQAQMAAKDPALASATLRTSDVIISDNPLKSIQESLSRAQVDHRVLESQVAALESTLDEAPSVPEILVDRQVDQRPEVQEVISQINQKRVAMEQVEAAAVRGKEDPRYTDLETQITSLETTLNALRTANRSRIQNEMTAMSALERQQQLEDLRTQLITQRLIVQNMRSNYDQMVKDLSLSGSQTLDLRLKEHELTQLQTIFDRISDRAAQLATEMYAPRRVEPVQNARIPEVPLETLPWKQLLLAVVGSLCVPFGLCALFERSVKRVTSIEQLQVETSLPVIGEIARLPMRQPVVSASRGANYELGLFEESVDSLRTGLILSHDRSAIQVLAVTSAVSGEGKSSVASQLAVSLARASSMPVLLIDGDMRAPDLHRIFQINVEPGLANVLDGSEKITACINKNWSDNVHVLPAGRLAKSPHKLLGGYRFEAVLKWTRRRYRYIVIDTPPVLAASESMVMARLADGVLLCAMRDVSRESHVRMALDRLTAVGAKPMGTVLSGVPTRQYARRYGSYAYTQQ
ncbi:MAG: polysaccharide biosynthesis tyrosine autokinase [Planctomycetales bacterium]|nr:polysaccharide biosynthesis tyrosine autokinase [Planctomycetales bacterium]